MTALLTASLPEYLDDEPVRTGRPDLRLVAGARAHGVSGSARRRTRTTGRRRRSRPPRRRVSAEVRRRRTLLAMMGLALALLAFPLGGFGGPSHTTESASAAQIHPVDLHVQPGDTLWSIAERMDPTGDPRPLVSQLAARARAPTTSCPGEQITLP